MIYLYHHKENNFGDNCSPFIVASLLSDKEQLKAQKPDGRHPVLMALGSILQRYPLDKCIIWGAGCMWAPHQAGKYPVKGTPKLITAVRGPHTRRTLRRAGIACPSVYGDPGLLLPRIVKPSQQKKYRVGIVPHVIDYGHDWVEKWRGKPDVCIIDLREPVHEVIEEITSCHVIISSALHGLVTADAYGIPSLWTKLSTKVLGHGFKFRDYFASIHQSDCNRIIIKPETTLRECIDQTNRYKINLDISKLEEVFPGKILKQLGGQYEEKK